MPMSGLTTGTAHRISRRPGLRWPDAALRYLSQARDFFARHGARSIILARFVPLVRTFAPIVAGTAEMRYRTFVFDAVGRP